MLKRKKPIQDLELELPPSLETDSESERDTVSHVSNKKLKQELGEANTKITQLTNQNTALLTENAELKKTLIAQFSSSGLTIAEEYAPIALKFVIDFLNSKTDLRFINESDRKTYLHILNQLPEKNDKLVECQFYRAKLVLFKNLDTADFYLGLARHNFNELSANEKSTITVTEQDLNNFAAEINRIKDEKAGLLKKEEQKPAPSFNRT